MADDILSVRAGVVQVRKVKVHASIDDCYAHKIEYCDLVGNHAADFVARAGADTVEINEVDADTIDHHDMKAHALYWRVLGSWTNHDQHRNPKGYNHDPISR